MKKAYKWVPQAPGALSDDRDPGWRWLLVPEGEEQAGYVGKVLAFGPDYFEAWHVSSNVTVVRTSMRSAAQWLFDREVDGR
jgi:hypothetical protein